MNSTVRLAAAPNEEASDVEATTLKSVTLMLGSTTFRAEGNGAVGAPSTVTGIVRRYGFVTPLIRITHGHGAGGIVVVIHDQTSPP